MEKMNPIVYIVHDSGGKNFLPAKEFGELRVILSGNLDELGLAGCIAKLKQDLADFSCDVDFLLPVGDPVLMAIASALVGQMSDGFFTILHWNRTKYEYDDIQVQL